MPEYSRLSFARSPGKVAIDRGAGSAAYSRVLTSETLRIEDVISRGSRCTERPQRPVRPGRGTGGNSPVWPMSRSKYGCPPTSWGRRGGEKTRAEPEPVTGRLTRRAPTTDAGGSRKVRARSRTD